MAKSTHEALVNRRAIKVLSSPINRLTNPATNDLLALECSYCTRSRGVLSRIAPRCHCNRNRDRFLNGLNEDIVCPTHQSHWSISCKSYEPDLHIISISKHC